MEAFDLNNSVSIENANRLVPLNTWHDRYGGEWPRERFREHGLSYKPAAWVARKLRHHLRTTKLRVKSDFEPSAYILERPINNYLQ